MLALYFDGQPAIKELPRPEPGPGEVLVRVHLAGICRTDLEVLKGYHGFTGIMGHEFVGEVAAPEDSPWLGQRVVGEINLRLRGVRPLPPGSGRALPPAPGVGAQGPRRRLCPLPHPARGQPPRRAFPGSGRPGGLHRTPGRGLAGDDRGAGDARVARVLVVGDGSLGLQIAWVLALSGADVHLAGHHPEHLALARPRGVATFLAADLPAGDYDIVVEASGSPSGMDLALARVRPRGTVVMKSTYAGRYPLDPAAPGGPRGQPGGQPLRAFCRRPATPQGWPG